MLTLYHYWRSSSSWRVRWALAIKGISYHSVPVNILAAEHFAKEHRERNPSGFLPAIKVQDHYYAESLAILEWLEETYPHPPLLPKEPLDRLYIRQLALTIVAGTQPLQNPSWLKTIAPDDATRREALARAAITQGLSTFEALVKQHGKVGRYCLGDQLTMAELCLIPQVYNALRFGVDMQALPLCSRLYEDCLKLASCELAAPHRQEGAASP